MNDNETLRSVPLSFCQIVELMGTKQDMIDSINDRVRLKNYQHIKGFYNQSSISDIVDQYRGIMTLGRCYNKLSYEIKI